MVYSDLELIDGNGATIHPSFAQCAGLHPQRGQIVGKLLVANFVSGGGCMLRGCLKDIFHPLPPHAAWEDWWWAWAIGSVAEVEYLDEPTYRYRRHGANLSLGASGAKLAAAVRHEVRFRRWMLATVRPDQASVDELVSGLWNLYRAAAEVSRGLGVVLEDALLPEPGGVGTHLRQAEDELAAGRPVPALFATVRALAADPLSPDARGLLARIAPGAENGVPAIAPEPPLTLDARDFVVVADADELVADPGTLAAYGRWFSAADDATLVIHASDWTEARVGTELPPLVAAAGLDRDDAPDMLALAVTPAQRAALRRAASAALVPGGDAAQLHILAQQHSKTRSTGRMG
jgi:hypothetical protein